MIKINFLAIFLQLFISSFVYAFNCENEQNIDHVLNQVDLEFNPSHLISCKANPQNENQLLMVYAVQQYDEEKEIGDYQLYILGVNHKNRKVDYFYAIEDKLLSDAVELLSITWDFAPYFVKPSYRIVGLRLNYSLRSQVHPYHATILNLYDLDNKKHILDSLIVNEYSVDTDTRCNADIEERNSVLVMRPTKTHGYFDIQVRSRLEHYEMTGDEENCFEINRKTSKQNFLLKFNGVRYVIPKSYEKDYQY